MSKRRPIPELNQPIFETHCHLDYLEPEALNDAVTAAAGYGVNRIVTIATEPDNLDRVLEIAAQFDQVFCTQGIHPHEAEKISAEVLTRIAVNSRENRAKVRAIGEIGLDYYYDHSDRAVQRRMFIRQLELAAELELPVVIHTREADEDTREILKEYAPSLSAGGVIHSFTSGQQLAEFCLDQGFMLGFNGIITFNKAENVRDILRMTPVERMVIETDAPYLTPVPYRGVQNEPRYLPFILQRMADEKQMTVAELAPQLYSNAEKLFRF